MCPRVLSTSSQPLLVVHFHRVLAVPAPFPSLHPQTHLPVGCGKKPVLSAESPEPFAVGSAPCGSPGNHGTGHLWLLHVFGLGTQDFLRGHFPPPRVGSCSWRGRGGGCRECSLLPWLSTAGICLLSPAVTAESSLSRSQSYWARIRGCWRIQVNDSRVAFGARCGASQ